MSSRYLDVNLDITLRKEPWAKKRSFGDTAINIINSREHLEWGSSKGTIFHEDNFSLCDGITHTTDVNTFVSIKNVKMSSRYGGKN